MITVMFSCHGCALERHKLQVPARENPDVEALMPWMEKVQRLISEEHRKVSPRCRQPAFDLYLPAPPSAEFVGQQIE